MVPIRSLVMHRLAIVFLLLLEAPLGRTWNEPIQSEPTKQPTSLAVLRQENFEGYRIVRGAISLCIAQCLGIPPKGSSCQYDHKGRMMGVKCAKTFQRPKLPGKVLCVYENKYESQSPKHNAGMHNFRDLDAGLDVDTLVESELCTEILVLVMIKYDSKEGQMSIVDKALHKMSEELAANPMVRLFFRLGSDAYKNDSMTPKQFSNFFSMSNARTKWAAGMTEIALRSDTYHYKGLYLRWLYPGCPNDDCKVGPAFDEHSLVSAFEELRKKWKEKAPKKSFDIAMEMSAKGDNLYMGLGIFKLKSLINYFLILNYEWADPKRVVVEPLTGFQTPLLSNTRSMEAFLNKSATYSNKNFYFGITTILINFEIDQIKSFKKRPLKPILQRDQFFSINTNSDYINFTDACKLIQNPANNYTIVELKFDNSTSYAFNGTNFITMDDSSETIEKVSKFFDIYTGRIGGVWLKDLSADDHTGEVCGCGVFPVLRAANEGLYTTFCSTKSCFKTPPSRKTTP